MVLVCSSSSQLLPFYQHCQCRHTGNSAATLSQAAAYHSIKELAYLAVPRCATRDGAPRAPSTGTGHKKVSTFVDSRHWNPPREK